MSNSKVAKNRNNYKKARFDIMEFLNNGKLVDLSGSQNAIEVDLGNLGLVYDMEDNER